MGRPNISLLLFLALACHAQEPRETALLAKIKAQVAENLRRLPNFTCTETIQRSLSRKSEATPETIDNVRLEVAFVEGKELYGWPGASRIDEPDITKLAGGSVGNGYFALFLNNIFLVSSTTFHYIGPSKLEGRNAERFDYRVPVLAGAYRLRTSRGTAVVGYHGSFWVAEGGADPLRLNVIADDVPTDLGYGAATSLLEFGTTRIGARTYVLPQSAEFIYTDTLGNAHKSRLRFEACHEFVGESEVKFSPQATTPAATLPDDFTVDIDLLTPIDSATAAGGDAILAALTEDLRWNGTLVLPKGAKFSGRIAHITRNGSAYLLEFTFTSIDFDGGHADLIGRTSESGIDNWAKIRQTERLRLAPGTHLRLHSRLETTIK